MGRYPKVMRALLLVAATVTALLAPAAPAQAVYPGFTCDRADNANYGCNVSVSTLGYYKGWSHTTGGYCGGAQPSPDLIARLNAPRDAWRWTRSGWQHTSLPAEAQVYVWPYAVAWSWAWTSGSGWVAIHDSDLIINPYCPPGLP